MATIKWLTSAARDLDRIVEYFRQESPRYAETLSQGLIEQVRILELFPRFGRIVPELDNSDLREILFRNYRIVSYFNPETDIVEILSIFHSSRQFGGNEGTLEP